MIPQRHCDILQGKNNLPTVFVLHGFTSSKEQIRHLSKTINKMGYTTYACNARGHGNRKKMDRFDVEGTVNDWNELSKSVNGDIFVIGHSLGGAEAMMIGMTNPKVKKVFAIAPVHDQDYVIKNKKYLERRLFTQLDGIDRDFLTPAKIKERNLYTNPNVETYIIYDKSDAIVQIDQFQKMIQTMNIPSDHQLSYVTFPNGKFSIAHLTPTMRNRTFSFIKEKMT